MAKFIIDANLPYLFSLWKGDQFVHVFDIDDSMSDNEIWDFAKNKGLTIISKDADFSIKVLFNDPPPRVVHLKIGNMKMKDLHNFLSRNWNEIVNVSTKHKLTNVFLDRIEGID